MSELIDLTKKVETVLDLRKIPQDVKAQVCLVIDGSGSMNSLYRNGTVQKAVNRISAVAVKFDDNQELDVMVFSNDVNEANPATPAMFGNYVDKELIQKNLVQFGGTDFVPFINKVVGNYFSRTVLESVSSSIIGTLKSIFSSSKPSSPVTSSKSASGYPIFCIIITDGENNDQHQTTTLLKGMQDKDIYWQFIGIGNVNFRYLKTIANDLPNVGFFEIKDLNAVKDMELYKQLVSDEFASWIKKF